LGSPATTLRISFSNGPKRPRAEEFLVASNYRRGTEGKSQSLRWAEAKSPSLRQERERLGHPLVPVLFTAAPGALAAAPFSRSRHKENQAGGWPAFRAFEARKDARASFLRSI